MADPTRRLIPETLRMGPMPVGVIAARLPVSRPAVSQHLLGGKTRPRHHDPGTKLLKKQGMAPEVVTGRLRA